MLIGYARVSTDDQNLDLQRDALRLAGCEKIYEDRMSGAKAARPGLTLALEVARAGDVLTVWRLDRLGRSLHDLILLGRKLDELGIGLMSVQEKIDTCRVRVGSRSSICLDRTESTIASPTGFSLAWYPVSSASVGCR